MSIDDAVKDVASAMAFLGETAMVLAVALGAKGQPLIDKGRGDVFKADSQLPDNSRIQIKNSVDANSLTLPCCLERCW